ncbi:hypothetical protein KFK09_019361 [Dendrobium nobile]|uniref:Uncharacterized protein n=1 Tax=Dendrobium nobile TaxID=94219 RepID=A0A8T3AR29_DENNO|nr:hypothetical protein KFK09_019357 [Dendrobium nobile]KAI0498474.1 hypothetical protein KFK09_019361 [Dendrobium nobile]
MSVLLFKVMEKYMGILLVEFMLDSWRAYCDRRVPLKLKEKIYKMVMKLAMLYGAECWPLKEKHKVKCYRDDDAQEAAVQRNYSSRNSSFAVPKSSSLLSRFLDWFRKLSQDRSLDNCYPEPTGSEEAQLFTGSEEAQFPATSGVSASAG